MIRRRGSPDRARSGARVRPIVASSNQIFLFYLSLCLCMKQCTTCGLERDEAEFYIRIKRGRSILAPSCKECARKKALTYYHAHRYGINEAHKQWLREHPIEGWVTHTCQAHKISELYEDILWMAKRTKKCPICGCVLTYRDGKATICSATLDRRENNDSKDPKDFWVICLRCNITKGSRNMAEMTEWSKAWLISTE